MLFLLLQESGLDRDYLLCRRFPLEAFNAGFPYAAEPVIIVCSGDAMAGTPVSNSHASWTILAFPNLGGPFL